MRRRGFALIVLLWLGWYLSGPLCETFDFWDTPRQEFHDIASNAGGGIALIAAAFSVGIALARRWRERATPHWRTLRSKPSGLSLDVSFFLASLFNEPIATHSPPLPLRI